ncbi:MAG TPA: FtsX-like permease family protein [Polyangia bacterium]|jgi:putative ABC transport system permease protein|nr:FtsX-like permease family protein [Polyangia bacterium]
MWTLARKILLYDRVKFLVAAAGVSVSVFLVLVQIGLYLGFMQNASNIIDHARADLWVASAGTENFDVAAPMDERTYYRVAETPGVERAERMVLAFGQFKMPSGGAQGVEVVGLERGARLFWPWNVVEGDARGVGEVDGIVVDRSEFAKLEMSAIGDRREITGMRSRIVALTQGIRSFTTSPYIFTNIHTARAYTRLTPDQITYVLVSAAPGVNIARLRDRLNRIPYVSAYEARDFSARARSYWSERTGVGVGFFMTAMMGVIVGLVVVGQILYNGTLEHIREYGTMKAMGAENGAIVRVILYQALISAALGLILGGVMAVLARSGLRAANLSVLLTPGLMAATAVLTAVMCSLASLLSIVKVLRLDPASVFKG